MRWGRGLFRLWVVVSVFWLVAAGAFAAVDWRDHPMPIPPEFCKHIEPDRVAGCEKGQTSGREEVTTRRQITIAVVIAPPLVLLIIGLAMWWVMIGFRPSQPVTSASRS
jgi:hypothetical protein